MSARNDTGPTPERETNPYVEVFAEDWNSKEDAVYDAPGPTPERRWRVEKARGSFGRWLVLRRPDNKSVAHIRRSLFQVATVDLLDTLNEAETLRAERDALTERVRVLEASLERVLGDCYEIFDADGNDYRDDLARTLAGAETEAGR